MTTEIMSASDQLCIYFQHTKAESLYGSEQLTSALYFTLRKSLFALLNALEGEPAKAGAALDDAITILEAELGGGMKDRMIRATAKVVTAGDATQGLAILRHHHVDCDTIDTIIDLAKLKETCPAAVVKAMLDRAPSLDSFESCGLN